MNEIYIDVGFGESRVALIDDGGLAEIYIERQGVERVAGNIYKGKVTNVLPGMQAAFINIGLDKNAFLYVKDAISCDRFDINNVSISDFIKVGQDILVQVSKEPSGNKGARVTTHITLPGRYIVLMPSTNYVGVSRRIEDENERNRLRNISSGIMPKGYGFIIRTEAEGRSAEDFAEDIDFLTRLLEKINKAYLSAPSPCLIHKDLDIIYKSIRDSFTRDTEKIIINDYDSYKEAAEIVELYSPGMGKKVEHYTGDANIMAFYGIEKKINEALSRKVWLKSGGYLVIDETEALISIDVNTGKFTGSFNIKDTILQTNIEASIEIARQLRLRDISGIIIIDYIDMTTQEDKYKVIDVLKKELKKDRTRSNVLGITSLGLVEMTRKKVGKKLSAILEKRGPLCQGSGMILDEESIIKDIERDVERIFKSTDVLGVMVEVNINIARYLEEHHQSITHIEEKYNKKVYIKGLFDMKYSDVNIKLLNDDSKVNSIIKPFEVGDKVGINAIETKYLNKSDKPNLFNGSIENIEYDGQGKPKKVLIELSYLEK